MNAVVVLSLGTHQFAFPGPAECTLGRASDCEIHVPTSDRYAGVSRHHCRFDIDPPGICVRDLGSLNGTFVNGRNIGQRHAPAAPAATAPAACWLRDGDEVRAGDIVLQVSITTPDDPMLASENQAELAAI